MNKITKAILPVAGKGQRLMPLTKNCSKTMLIINRLPILGYVIEEAIAAGITELILVIHEEQNDVRNFVERYPIPPSVKVTFVLQEERHGMGDAILICSEIVKDEDFLVLTGDDIVMSNGSLYGIGDLVHKYDENPAYYLGIRQYSENQVRNYGVIDSTDFSQKIIKVRGIFEKPQGELPSLYATAGRYVLRNSIFKYLRETVVKPGCELQLSDAIHAAAQEEDVYAYQFVGERYDLGTLESYEKAKRTIEFKYRIF